MRCPRCHQPLDFAAEGLYMCCAGAARRWRCTSCQAAHDGFAFAYGACPGCGGRLVAADETAPDDAVLAGVRMAFEIELGGRAFYQRAAADSRDAQMRALFERFAAMEGEHMETLSHRYHVRTAEASAPLRLELAALFGGVEHRPQDPDNLFRIAVAIERRAARLFTEHADRADSGSTDGELFRELAAEEVEHAVYLDAEHQRWRAGQPVLTRHGAALQAPVTQAAPINAAELLLGGHDAGQGALQCGEHRISRGALREWAARCAAVWAARGLRPGDRVAIKLPDGLDWVAAFMGCLWAGVVAVAVNPRIPRTEWQYILDEAGFSVILAETDNDDDTPEPWRARVLPLDAWRAECERRQPVDVQPMQPDAPALWCHSSGTSGQPKAVVHAHRFALEVDRVSREGLGVRSGERVFATSKLFFAYPQTNALFAGLKLGATVILDPLWPTAQSVAATVAAQRPHVLFSVPSLYRNLLHEGDLAQDMARHGVRLCVSAGE
ncbi:MAG TPA: AMP-binding protein, partial [Burkholderiaceae bacterium]